MPDLSVVTTEIEGEDFSWLRSSRLVSIPGTLDVSKLTAGTHYDAYGFIKGGLALSYNTATNMFEPWGAPTNEVQTATVTGSPTGGTFTLTFAGENGSKTTAAIAYNATAAAVQAALIATGIFKSGDVVVTGSAGGPYTITFGGEYAGINVGQITATASLTGGTSPGVTMATTTQGGTAGATDASLDGVLYTGQYLRFIAGTLVTTQLQVPVLKEGAIVPAKMPLTPALNVSTPTTCVFVYVGVPHP